VVSIPWCTHQATQVKVMWRWHEAVCCRYKAQICIWQIGYSKNLAHSSWNQSHARWNQVFWRARFVLNKWQPIFPQNIFRGENYIPINREMLWPITRNGKVVCQIMPFKMSNLRYNQWEVGQFLEEIINPPFGGSPS
jgi:hypothetical protein